jgi:aminoglycoside phosphotransferase (APT) family kinase protein
MRTSNDADDSPVDTVDADTYVDFEGWPAPRPCPPIDADLVRRLVRAQFPRWAHLPIRPVVNGGHDNRTFHLGDSMTVRLPSAVGYEPQVAKEQAHLPRLAAHLPLPIPAPLAQGVPDEGYPFSWSVYAWLEGEPASIGHIADLTDFATALATFLTALQQSDATGGPRPGLHSAYRGGPLTTYDAETRQAIATLGDRIDGAAATEVWETALRAKWDGRPVWFHGDVAVGNLLVSGGRLSAVIDFGCSGIGDPACDLAIAWTLFSGKSQRTFRDILGVDDGTWARGRAWVLWKSLITYPDTDTHPERAAAPRRDLDHVLREFAAQAA